jgi:periplasmic protein CpxP/Spy
MPDLFYTKSSDFQTAATNERSLIFQIRRNKPLPHSVIIDCQRSVIYVPTPLRLTILFFMKTLKLLFISLALGVAGAPLIAADQTDAPPSEGRRGKGAKKGAKRGEAGQDGPQGRGQVMNPDARVANLDRELNLTAEQKTKLTDIFAKSREEMQGMRGGGDDKRANRERMQQMMQATQDQVQSVLTDEQKKKFQEMERPGRGGPGGERPRKGEGKRKKDA